MKKFFRILITSLLVLFFQTNSVLASDEEGHSDSDDSLKLPVPLKVIELSDFDSDDFDNDSDSSSSPMNFLEALNKGDFKAAKTALDSSHEDLSPLLFKYLAIKKKPPP